VANSFSTLIEKLRAHHPGVKGECSQQWGTSPDLPRATEAASSTENPRLMIRASIGWALKDLTPEDIDLLKVLDEPPRPVHWSVSISHCAGFGGWIALPRPAQVGWDVELKSRISFPIIERVCSSQEIAQSPHAHFLWCAKEAFFKALEDFQPLAITQLTISNWKPDGPSVWYWDGLGPHNGHGVLINDADYVLAACTV
jgi:4'-phosphopantetheinyl transferase EntD